MPKVMHLITGLNTGGAEMMLCKLMVDIDKAKNDHFVVSMMNKGTLGDDIINNGVKVYTLDMKRGTPSLSSLFKLREIIKLEKPDIIQTWLYHADLLGYIAAKLFHIKKIIWNIRCSNMDLKQYSFATRIVLQILVRFSRNVNAIIVNSIAGKELHKELGYKANEWVDIPNGFDLEKYRPADQAGKNQFRLKNGLSPDRLLIGMVARYDPMKGHKVFIEAAHTLIQQYQIRDVTFILIGRGVTWENAELVNRISQYNLKELFILLGERKDIPDILPNLDLYISASIFGEGFPNVIGEAMSCGIPCVSTDVGDSARIIDQYGLTVPPNDSDALADSIKQMLEKKEDERANIGYESRRHIERNYDIIEIVKKYQVLYDRVK